MRNRFTSFVFFILASFYLVIASNPDATNEISVQGFYFGKNLIVINPMNGSEFATKAVYVNDVIYKDEINSCAFEIDLSRFELEIGDEVTIRILYSGSHGTPQIYNPEALYPENTFSFASVECDKKAMNISWTVEGNDITESFELEHYRWDKWMTVKLINPLETKTYPSFTTSFVPHSGRNLFRVKYIDSDGNIYYSSEIKYTSRIKEVMLLSDKVKTTIDFSEETLYQLYDENGALVLDGWGISIDIESLEKGKYFLNYDSKTSIIYKR